MADAFIRFISYVFSTPCSAEPLLTKMLQLQRHGARYPNADDGEQYSDAVSRLTSANRFTDKHLKWLKDYEYELGSEDLVPFGAAQ